MSQKNLFNTLTSRLRNANSQPPKFDCVALGFTNKQIMTMSLKKPHLIFYHAATNTFHDQGDSTKIKKSNWTKVNSENYKNKPMNDLKYYIPIDDGVMSEANASQFD